jgi:glutathione S-transferase
MPIDYIDFKQAKDQSGLRMVVVSGIPSPWSEAAKGIFHVKNIKWSAVRLDQRDNEQAQWTGSRSGPVVILDNQAPQSGWQSILLLAESLSSSPALLPKEAVAYAKALEMCDDICGEAGLGWSGRLEGVHSGLNDQGGFPKPIAQYLGAKYGYEESLAKINADRLVVLLHQLAKCLRDQKHSGSRFYMGGSLSAVDIYSATFMAYFKPLEQSVCPMDKQMRAAFESNTKVVTQALDPILLAHRDFMYEQFLELPLSL